MPHRKELKIVILYTIYVRNFQATSRRVLEVITSSDWIKSHSDDDIVRTTRETKLENDLRWNLNDLRADGYLESPKEKGGSGVWPMTQAGKEKLEGVALRSLKYTDDDLELLLELGFNRYTQAFLDLLKELGRKIQERQAQQDAAANP